MKTSSNRSEQTRSKPEKTRAQKDAHNASCRKSRQKNKSMREELKKKYTEMELNFQRMQDENKRIKLELNDKNSQIRTMEETLQKQKEEKARMEHILDQWKLKEGCSSSVEECQDWILRQRYDQVGQGSDYTSLLTGPAAQPSLLSNQNLFSASDVQITDNDFLLPQCQSGVLTDSPTWYSLLANQNLSDQDWFSMISALHTDDNDYATGFPTASAAGLPDFTHHEPAVKHDEVFGSEKNPPSKRN